MITINNRDKIDWFEGITVRDVFEKMGFDYSLISVHIEDEYIPEEEYATRKISDDSSLYIIHLAHGG